MASFRPADVGPELWVIRNSCGEILRTRSGKCAWSRQSAVMLALRNHFSRSVGWRTGIRVTKEEIADLIDHHELNIERIG